MELQLRKKSRGDEMMHSNNSVTLVREIGRKEVGDRAVSILYKGRLLAGSKRLLRSRRIEDTK